MSALTWRPIEASDADRIFNANTGNVAKYFYEFKDLDEVKKWVNEAIKKHAEGSKLEYMLFDGEEFVGMISPCYISKEIVEIGIWVAEDKQGKGYGKKVIEELVNQLRTEGITEVIYETEKSNLPSIRLAETLGMEREDTDDSIRFSKSLMPLH